MTQKKEETNIGTANFVANATKELQDQILEEVETASDPEDEEAKKVLESFSRMLNNNSSNIPSNTEGVQSEEHDA